MPRLNTEQRNRAIGKLQTGENLRQLRPSLRQCAAQGITAPASLYVITEARQCSFNSGLDHDVEDGRQPELIYGTLKTSIKFDITTDGHARTTLWPYIKDCYGIVQFNAKHFNATAANVVYLSYMKSYCIDKRGVYVLHPDDYGDPIDVWCDGSGTVIQRRLEDGLNFYRNWSDYVEGFGDTTGEYWLGLRDQHRLTRRSVRMQLEFDPPDTYDICPVWNTFTDVYKTGVWPVLLYHSFTVGDETSKFLLQHKVFKSRLMAFNDIVYGSKQLQFSTLNNDNDFSDDDNFAQATQSGWWIGNVSEPNPNSPYTDPDRSEDDTSTGRLFSWSTPYLNDIDWPVNRTTIKIASSEVVWLYR